MRSTLKIKYNTLYADEMEANLRSILRVYISRICGISALHVSKITNPIKKSSFLKL